jgi:hypothetical protein
MWKFIPKSLFMMYLRIRDIQFREKMSCFQIETTMVAMSKQKSCARKSEARRGDDKEQKTISPGQ